MPTFPSLEWAEAYRDALNRREGYREAAKGLTADFLFHVRAGDGLPEDHFMWVRLDDGKCVHVDESSAADDRDPTFTLRGDYAEWVRLLKGESDPVQAILTRRLEVKGSMAELMRYVRAAKELGKATRDVDTVFR